MFIKNQLMLGEENGFYYADEYASGMGCEPVAAYNVLHAAGKNVSFQEVLYETDIGTVGGGANILVIGKYLEDQGYEVNYLLGDMIDRESNKYESLIVSCAGPKVEEFPKVKLDGHYYIMIPTGKENEEGVINPGKEKGLNIHLAIGVKK